MRHRHLEREPKMTKPSRYPELNCIENPVERDLAEKVYEYIINNKEKIIDDIEDFHTKDMAMLDNKSKRAVMEEKNLFNTLQEKIRTIKRPKDVIGLKALIHSIYDQIIAAQSDAPIKVRNIRWILQGIPYLHRYVEITYKSNSGAKESIVIHEERVGPLREERMKFDFHASNLNRRNDSIELEAVSITMSNWKRRCVEKYESEGPTSCIQEIGKIFFKECGYATPPTILETYPWLKKTYQKLFPKSMEKFDAMRTWEGLTSTKMGNCEAKTKTIMILAEQVSKELSMHKDNENSIEVNINELFLNFTKESFEKEGFIDAYQDLVQKYARKKQNVSLKEIRRYQEVKNRKEDPEILLFKEISRIFNIGELKQTDHVRIIARIKNRKNGSITYWAIEKKGAESIYPWKPEEGRVFADAYDDPNLQLACIIGKEFNLPDDFVFSAVPENKKGEITFRNPIIPRITPIKQKAQDILGDNDLRETGDIHSKEDAQEEKENGNAVAAVMIAIAAEDAPVQQPKEYDALLKKHSYLRTKINKLLTYVQENPLALGGVATLGALGIFLANEENIEAAGNAQKAALERASERTLGTEPFTDLGKAQPFSEHIADELDIIFAGKVDASGALTPESSFENITWGTFEKGHLALTQEKIVRVTKESYTQDKTRITCELNKSVVTVAPSFWIPFLRAVQNDAQENVVLSVQGDALNEDALLASFSDLWNRVQETSDFSQKTFSLFVNGKRVITHLGNTKKPATLTYSEHFFSKEESIFAIEAFTKDAYTRCVPYTQELPSAWTTTTGASWAFPLCDLK